MKNKNYSLKRILESIDPGIVGEVQELLNSNPWFKKIGVPTAKPEDVKIQDKNYVLFASVSGLEHIKERHADKNKPGSLLKSGLDIEDLIRNIMKMEPTKSPPYMVKWEGVQSPIGPVGTLGIAYADPQEVAKMKDYQMPDGGREMIKIHPGKRKETPLVTLVTSKLGQLSDGRTVLSLITLYPGGQQIDNVDIPFNRGEFAAKGFYFVLPPESSLLKGSEESSGIRESYKKTVVKTVTKVLKG